MSKMMFPGVPEGTDLSHLYTIHRMATDLLAQYKLEGWSVKWMRSHHDSGVCDHVNSAIRLSAPLMALWTADQAKDTILHEIAHALTPGHVHDRTWQAMCIRIGADPTRTWGHNDEARVQEKYVGICPNGHIHYRARWTKSMNTPYAGTCRKCSRHWDAKYRVTWREA